MNNKNEKTKFEREHIAKVKAFMKKTGQTMSKIGNSQTVHYSNLEKLNDYYVRGTGKISTEVAGRIDKYIDEKIMKIKNSAPE